MAWVIGDVVRLKSGGPRMTIQKTTPHDCNCAWFIGADVRTGGFPNEAVMASNGPNESEDGESNDE